MTTFHYMTLLLICTTLFHLIHSQTVYEIKTWLTNFDTLAAVQMSKLERARLQYYKDMSDVLGDNLVEMEKETEKFLSNGAKKAKDYLKKADSVLSEDTKRHLTVISRNQFYFGYDVLNNRDKLYRLMSNMQRNYAESYACLRRQKNVCHEKIDLYPNLGQLLASTNDTKLQAQLWYSWHENVQEKNSDLYDKFISLAKYNAAYSNLYDYWIDLYESAELENDLNKLEMQILPLYEQLHAYVRRTLRRKYNQNDYQLSSIEINQLRDLHSNNWVHLLADLMPYRTAASTDITELIVRQNYTTEAVYKLVDSMYKTVGLMEVPLSLWTNSVFERSASHLQSCFPHATNLFEDYSYAVIDCDGVSSKQLSTAFQLLGKIQYFQHCNDLPLSLRRQAPLGLPEAIGGVVELMSTNPASLEKIGMFDGAVSGRKENINHLMKVALQTLPRIAFYASLDRIQKSLFSEKISKEQLPIRWAAQRYENQGLFRPSPVAEEPVMGPVHYFLYENRPAFEPVLATVLQFQLFESMCSKINLSIPVHLCSASEQYKSENAEMLKNLMKSGLLLPFSTLLKRTIGVEKIDAGALLRYFQPLYRWLKRKNEQSNECYGWRQANLTQNESEIDHPRCNKTLPIDQLSEAKAQLKTYEESMRPLLREVAVAWWNFETNETDLNHQKVLQMESKKMNAENEIASSIRTIYTGTLLDEEVKEAVEKIRRRQIDVDPKKYGQLLELKIQLAPGGKVKQTCPAQYSNCLSDKQIEEIMANETELEVLTNVWKEWHDRTGKPFKESMMEFVSRSNALARSKDYDNVIDALEEEWPNDMDKTKAEELWFEILPFYEELHSYVRSKLQIIYMDRFNVSHLPAHIIGSVNGAQWSGLRDTLSLASSGDSNLDAYLKQTLTTEEIVRKADEFFESIGMPKMTQTFWEKSVYETSEQTSCTTSAWDMYEDEDFRAKICNRATRQNYLSIFEAIGRIQYAMHSVNQSLLDRKGLSHTVQKAMDGFFGLCALHNNTQVENVDFLLTQALHLIPQISLDYVSHAWLEKTFGSPKAARDANAEWWNLRKTYQGIINPVSRSEEDFDPPADIPYSPTTWTADKFYGAIVQFDIFENLCALSGHRGQLHRCNLYGSKIVGQQLASVFTHGSKMSSGQFFQTLTNNTRIGTKALLDYFQPLREFLKNQSLPCFGWGAKWETKVADQLKHPRCDEHMDWPAEEDVRKKLLLEAFLKNYTEIMTSAQQQLANAKWLYSLETTERSRTMLLDALTNKYQVEEEQRQLATQLNIDKVDDEEKQNLLDRIRESNLNFNVIELIQLIPLMESMSRTFDESYVCPIEDKNCDSDGVRKISGWKLIPDLINIMRKSENATILKYVWLEWREKTAKALKNPYEAALSIYNAAAMRNGYENLNGYFKSLYGFSSLEKVAERLWKRVLPTYEQLHAYVRSTLLKNYGNATDDLYLSAHLLGNVWAKDWSTLPFSPFFETPYKEATVAIQRKNLTTAHLVKEAEAFFESIGFGKIPPFFWNTSIFGEESDMRKCKSGVQNFYNGKDYAMRFCSEANVYSLLEAHYLMTLLQFSISYKEQPIKFQSSPNPSFHRAVAGAIQLSVSNIEHLRKLDLLDQKNDSKERYIRMTSFSEYELSVLYERAMKILPLLSYTYATDLCRSTTATGENVKKPNITFWANRRKYEGVIEPNGTRADLTEIMLEPQVFLIKPHMQEMFSNIMQFQIYKALCEAANHQGPIHRCDISGSSKAGKLLLEAFQLGSSRDWRVAYEKITNSTEISVEPMLEYFSPLTKWLSEMNKENQNCYGWGEVEPAGNLPSPRCKKSSSSRGTLSLVLAVITGLAWIWHGQSAAP